MPFKSEKQRRYLWANEPEIARDWTETYGTKIKKAEGGISQLVKPSGDGKRPGYYGADYGHSYDPGHADTKASKDYRSSVSSIDSGGEPGGSEKQFQDTRKALNTAEAEKKIKAEQKAKAKKKSFLEEQRQKGIKNFVKRNKYKNLIKSGVYQDFPGLWGKIFGYMSPPDEVEDFDIDSIKEIAAQSQYTPGGLSKMQSKGLAGLRKDLEFEKKYADKDPTQKEFMDYYGLNKTIPGGDGGGQQPLWMQLGYPSYEAWQAAQGQGGTIVAEEVVEEASPFQQSLNTGIAQGLSPYYVGGDPTAANLAWGQQFGVDPRTMYRTTWADGGPIRQRYFLGKLVKKIGRAAKKVIKSPIGKIGLLGLGGYYLGGGQGLWGSKMFGQKFGQKFALDNLMQRKVIPQLFTKDGKGTAWDPWKLAIGATTLAPFLMGTGKEEEEGETPFDYQAAKNAYLNEIMNIRRNAMAGTLDPSQFVYQGIKDGGRAGYYEGGQSIPSENSLEAARKTAMQDRLGGITEVMKQADLYRQGDVGQMYMAEGGPTQEAGIMDLGGMEKDYRETGGFVPIGEYEKKDDVPARLSLNEFVMTADAVRGMGDGDVDKGAERMEDLMETLEVKGKKNQGASDMFEVSERLSAVV